jgi:hypothetical protein
MQSDQFNFEFSGLLLYNAGHPELIHHCRCQKPEGSGLSESKSIEKHHLTVRLTGIEIVAADFPLARI